MRNFDPEPGRVEDNPAGLWSQRLRFESAPGYVFFYNDVVL